MQRGFRVGLVEDEGSGFGFQNRFLVNDLHKLEAENPKKGLGRLEVLFRRGLRVDVVTHLAWLEEQCKRFDLLFLDPLGNLHSYDESKQQEMTQLWDGLASIREMSGCAIAPVHHTAKVSWEGGTKPQLGHIHGSNVFGRRVDWALILRALWDKSDTEGDVETVWPKRMEVHQVKVRDGENLAVRVMELHRVLVVDAAGHFVTDEKGESVYSCRVDWAEGSAGDILRAKRLHLVERQPAALEVLAEAQEAMTARAIRIAVKQRTRSEPSGKTLKKLLDAAVAEGLVGTEEAERASNLKGGPERLTLYELTAVGLAWLEARANKPTHRPPPKRPHHDA